MEFVAGSVFHSTGQLSFLARVTLKSLFFPNYDKMGAGKKRKKVK